MGSPLRLLPRSGLTVDAGGCRVASSSKTVWRGVVGDGLAVPKGAQGRFSVHVHRGLVRLGWLADGGDVDNLGKDDRSFGYGGTGKRSHAGVFSDYGGAFGPGDILDCNLDRSDDRLRIEYSRNGVPLGAAFDFTAQEAVVQDLAELVMIPAICGRDFEAELVADGGRLGGAAGEGRSGVASRTGRPAVPSPGSASALLGPTAPAAAALRREELGTQIRYYMALAHLRCSGAAATPGQPSQVVQPASVGKGKKASTSTPGRLKDTDPEVLLRDFFLSGRDELAVASSEPAVERWLASTFAPSFPASSSSALTSGAAKASARAKAEQKERPLSDLASLKEVQRVQRTVSLPSGAQLTLIDSKPADSNAADRLFAQNLAVWEALPRGHAEVHEGLANGPLLRKVAALRKFGSSEEKFGPLAREAGSSRRAALAALPSALAACSLKVGACSASLVFLTKENGEMCKVSMFELRGTPYLILGSKNVVLAVSAQSREALEADAAAYTEERYKFAKEMLQVLADRFFGEMSAAQRQSMARYVCDHNATLCGESISPEHQHIQSYRDQRGVIRPEIRFFAITSPASFDEAGLTLVDPIEARDLFRGWGLAAVEELDEADISDAKAVRDLEEKHLMKPNREGAVVYVVVRQKGDGKPGAARTALVYKWKNAWYVTVRALREKFCQRVPEGRIRNRISTLHVHHPDEASIVEDFVGFYRWSLALLPVKDFDEHLRASWVALKAAYDDFSCGRPDWALALPAGLRQDLGDSWIERFPSLVAAIAEQIPVEIQTEALLKGSKGLRALEPGEPDWAGLTARALAASVLGRPLQGAVVEAVARPAEDTIGLTVVLVRGLQGSGKSTLCRSLRALLGGRWVNQDEVAAAAGPSRRGTTAKERFLQAIEVAAADPANRYIWVDKIHILKQHRDDVRQAVAKGAAQRPAGTGRVATALLDMAHPEDEEGECLHAAPVCTARIQARGLGHRTLVPQAVDAEEVVAGTSRAAEAVSDEEKCAFDLFGSLDLRQGPEELLASAVAQLRAAQLLSPEAAGGKDLLQDAAQAVATSKLHEQDLRGQWKTLYWSVKLGWEDLLWGPSGASPAESSANDEPRAALRRAVAQAIAMPSLGAAEGEALQAVDDPHVTLLWLGGQEPADEVDRNMADRLAGLEGQTTEVRVTAVCADRSLGLVALRAQLGDGVAELCANVHPHITTARRPEVPAVLSNEMLKRQAAGDENVQQVVLSEPVFVIGTVCRRLAPESLAAAAGGATATEAGSPVCELGLATTREAVDIWATHDSNVRWTRVMRALSGLFCSISEPLRHCKGWPPALRGKQWFTFHQRPLDARSLRALRGLEQKGQLQTLHVGVAYFEAPGVLTSSDRDAQKVQLKERLAGSGVEALENALEAWRAIRDLEEGIQHTEGSAEPLGTENADLVQAVRGTPTFYVHAKNVGSQEQTNQFRQALAAAVAELTGWEPTIKGADVALVVALKADWVLLGLALPKAAAAAKVEKDVKESVKAEPSARTAGAMAPDASSAAPAVTEEVEIPGAMLLNGAFLEGGGQLLRNAFAYAAVLGRAVKVENVRGGRKEPGLRPSHAAALDAVARLSGGAAQGVAVKSRTVAFVPAPSAPSKLAQQGDILIDAGTGGSTMLMLQAVLPVLLAQSVTRGGTPITATFRGGTNVAPPSGKEFKLNAPQVDYMQLVLFPTLRRLLGLELEMDLVRRGYLSGGGEVVVRASTPRWPLTAFDLTELGEPSRVQGVAYSSVGIPKHVLPRLLESTPSKGKDAGARPALRARLGDDIPMEIQSEEPATANGMDACGLVIVLETTTGCLLAGDSMGRARTPAETVGAEAARGALAAFDAGGCVDEHLADQLVIFMALAAGTSRLRLGRPEPSLHTRTAVWLAGEFGATTRLFEDHAGWLLEVDGIGHSLASE